MAIVNIKSMKNLCVPSMFTINGIKADINDFGYQKDLKPDAVSFTGMCGDMRFIPIGPTAEILKKYKIGAREYKEVCGEIKRELDFGWCANCL